MSGISHISISGYKSIRKMELDLHQLNILIGGNGAGKSNFLSFFKLLGSLSAGGPPEGHLREFVAREGGASTLLYRGPKRTQEISVRLDRDEGFLALPFLYTHGDQLALGPISMPFEGMAKVVEPISLLRGLGLQFRVYHFHDTSASAAVKQSTDLNDNRFLRSDAANLAAFLYLLRQAHPRSYDSIRDTVRLAAPFFDDLVLEPSPLNRQSILLRWREQDLDMEYNAHQLSDGTLRFLCLSTLLLQPPAFLPSVILLDEPELGLHPYAILLLASMLRGVSRHAQVIISTQSVALLDQLVPDKEDVEDVVVVERKDDQSVFQRLLPEQLLHWLEDFSPSELWEKGIIGGSPVA